MASFKIEKQNYKNFGECIKLTNSVVEALITIGFGPRVIFFGVPGGENILYEDIERKNRTSGDIMEAVFGAGSKWYNYGGHRLWLSPEDLPLTYYPDNERVVYHEIPGGVALIPPPQHVTDVQLRFEITLSEDKPKLTVKHYITNIGETTKHRAAWAVTVMSQGGLEVVPQPQHDTGMLANRILSVWPYTDLSDERVYWGKKYVTLRQTPEIRSPFKFGINNFHGWAAYFNHGDLFVKQYESNPSGRYPDYGASYETYANNSILEMESLGELVDITPGSTIFHSEQWTLVHGVECPAPNDETSIDTLVELYIER